MSRLEDWAPRIYRFALRLTGDRHAAEDLAQETCLRAWRHRQALRDERAERVWLFRIAVNLWRDGVRRTRTAQPLSGAEPDGQPAVEQLAEARDEAQRALKALDRLPPRQREVLYLNACEELKSAEIAEVLGISNEAVKSNLSLARKTMRTQLTDDGSIAARGADCR